MSGGRCPANVRLKQQPRPRPVTRRRTTFERGRGSRGWRSALWAGSAPRCDAAFADGGPKLLINTITQLTGLPIQHFLQIDFTGFKGMVNALGGVDVCLSLDPPLR